MPSECAEHSHGCRPGDWIDSFFRRVSIQCLVLVVRTHVSFPSAYRAVVVQTSCSLQHVPLDVGRETDMSGGVKERLAFAVQKLDELVRVAKGTHVKDVKSSSAVSTAPISRETLEASMFDRPAAYAERREAQFKVNPQVRSSK